MWRRKLVRPYPVFFTYIAWEVVQFLIFYPMALMPSVSGPTLFARLTPVGLAVSTGLRFGVIHEVFAHIFSNYPSFSAFGKPIFRWGTAILLMLGLLAAVLVGGHDGLRALSILWALSKTASILQCGLLVALFLFSSYLGLSWRNQVFGVALGLGVFATADLIAASVRSQFGSETTTSLDYITMAVYHCCVLIWLAYLWLPERATQFAMKTVPEHDLESWNEELQRLIRQ